MSARPYPSAVRARHQIARAARLRLCPACTHPVVEHAIEGEHRVCNRGTGLRVSCRVCAEFWASLPAFPGLAALAQALANQPSRKSFVLRG